jgi:DegV family protein with EDD domain
MLTILTDSTADLGKALTEKYAIQVLPLYVQHRDRTFRDGIDIDNAHLFQMVSETHELPKTSAASLADFCQAFTTAGEAVCITISSQLSGTFQNAVAAQIQTGNANIHVVDSLNLSTGIGLMVLYAADLRDQGCNAVEIERALLARRAKVHTSFVVETLDYIYMGGRCTAIQSIASSLLKIRPVIQVQPDGTLNVVAKIRGTRKKALDSMLEDLRRHLDTLDPRRIFVTHTDCPEDADYLRDEIQKIACPQEILITTAGSVVASHCGSKTIGILYLLK